MILVVVVIAVCAGVPWLVERQTRHSVARAHSGCERVLQALLSYRLDHGSIPISVNLTTFKIMCGEESEMSRETLLAFLTSPQAYLPSAPKPPFKIPSREFHGFLPAVFHPSGATGVIGVLCSGPGGPPDPSRSSAGDLVNTLWTISNVKISPRRNLWYAPSNGMLSPGWIYRDSKGNISPGG